MPNTNPAHVVLTNVRLSYTHLDKPYAQQQGQEPKYSATILVPKQPGANKAKMDAAIAAAIQKAIEKFGKAFAFYHIVTNFSIGSVFRDQVKILLHTELYECGQKLIDYAETVRAEKNRGTILKYFYENLQMFAWVNHAFVSDNARYLISQDSESNAIYLAISLPPLTSPIKTINGIRACGERISKEFVKPIGKIITSEEINEVMEYLEREYSFTSNVFKYSLGVFSIIKSSCLGFDSHCLISIKENRIQSHLFLYHMKDINPEVTPIGVFFHELGHTLHARFTGNMDNVPDKIIDILSHFFSGYKELTFEQQSEILADVLCMGLMYNSPFSKYDPFTYIHLDDKKTFNLLVKNIVSNLD